MTDLGAKKIAVIGSGIAGSSVAWLLANRHDVTLFEKNDYVGGHTHTHQLDDGYGGQVAVDSGFIVFNRPNYPHLTSFFEHLGVATQPTQMSFGMSMDAGKLEYSGDNLNTLFAQRSNLFRPGFLKMVAEILRFNKTAKQALTQPDALENLDLGGFLEQHRFSQTLADDYLLPMAAAIWSCPTGTMSAFPAGSFLSFFENHGLLNVNDRPQWETVIGGSNQYIQKITAQDRFQIHCNQPITQIERTDQGVFLPQTGQTFDAVVCASHADETLAMLNQPSAEERAILGAFSFQENIVYIHQDEALMPKRRAVWSCWNYLGQRNADGQRAVAVTYWMNRLQSTRSAKPWLVTLNPFTPPQAGLTAKKIRYQHPVFDQHTLTAQQNLSQIQGRDGLYYCGAWQGYGFHEDGIASAVAVARHLGCSIPWEE